MTRDSIFFSCTRSFNANKLNNLNLFYAIEPLIRPVVLFLLISYFLLINILPSYGETALSSKTGAELQSCQQNNVITKVSVFKSKKTNSVLNNDFFSSETGDDDLLAIIKHLPISNIIADRPSFTAYPQNDLVLQHLPAYTHFSFLGRGIYLRQRTLRI